MTLSGGKRAVVACMKDEGQFLLEWVAYHRAIGFDKVFLVTNDCSDGTDLIARRLTELDAVIHIPNRMAEGEAPQIAGMRQVMAHPALADVEWLLHLDADEFLNVTAGAGRVNDLIAHVPPGADAVAIAWRPMGSGGLLNWKRQSVLSSLTRTAKSVRPEFVMHKTMFRPDRFGWATDHMPKDPVAADPWICNAAGERIPGGSSLVAKHARYRGISDAQITWENADIHHYAVRARDVFLLKNVRGDGMGKQSEKYFVNSVFWRRVERNRAEDRSIQRHLAEAERLKATYLADPEIAALDDAAFAWFERMRDEYVTDANIRAWQVAE